MAYDIDEILEINKFSHLDDGERIFFCKTDYVGQILPRLGELDREVILISGNSDHVINEERFKSKPSNVVKWFCQNKHFDSEFVVAIPLGVQNYTPCKLGETHGYVWGGSEQKAETLSNAQDRTPTKMIYANFTTDNTRHYSREVWKQIALSEDHITWYPFGGFYNPYSSDLSYGDWVNSVLNHEAVLCPLGNSSVPEGDNHRIYETLYLGRIPIVHTKYYYEQLHHKFPVVLVKNLEDIADEDLMRKEIDKVKSQNFNSNYLKFSYWRDLILKEKEKLK